MSHKQRIILAGTIFGLILLGLLLAVFIAPKSFFDYLIQGSSGSTLMLIERASEFARALEKGRTLRLYNLFNPVFREEIPFSVFDSALNAWQEQRTIRRVATTHVEVHGISGLVSSHVYFVEPLPSETLSRKSYDAQLAAARRKYDYLFQTWLQGEDDWELMWVSNILDPITMDYGRKDTQDLQEILQLALDEIITREGIEQGLRLRNPSRYLVLVADDLPRFRFQLPDRKVVWLTRDSIDYYQAELNIPYYIQIMPLRVIGNLAVGTFDVVPVTAASGAATRRTRSIKLFFRRTEGKWGFASYGARW